jgi:ATP synthase protein I
MTPLHVDEAARFVNAETKRLASSTKGATTMPSERGRLIALSQVGLEMVAPIAVGLYLDNRFGWAPWGVVVGVVVGFVGGLSHLLFMLKRFEKDSDSQRNKS